MKWGVLCLVAALASGALAGALSSFDNLLERLEQDVQDAGSLKVSNKNSDLAPPGSTWKWNFDSQQLEEEEEAWPNTNDNGGLPASIASNRTGEVGFFSSYFRVKLNWADRTNKLSRQPTTAIGDMFTWVYRPSHFLREASRGLMTEFTDKAAELDLEDFLLHVNGHAVEELWPVVRDEVMHNDELMALLGNPEGIMLIGDPVYRDVVNSKLPKKTTTEKRTALDKERDTLQAIARAAPDRTCLYHECSDDRVKKDFPGAIPCDEIGHCTDEDCCLTQEGAEYVDVDWDSTLSVDGNGAFSCIMDRAFPKFHIDHIHQPETLGVDLGNLERGRMKQSSNFPFGLCQRGIKFHEMYNLWILISDKLCSNPLGVLKGGWKHAQTGLSGEGGSGELADVHISDMVGGEFLLFRTRDTLHSSISITNDDVDCNRAMCRTSVDFRFVTYSMAGC